MPERDREGEGGHASQPVEAQKMRILFSFFYTEQTCPAKELPGNETALPCAQQQERGVVLLPPGKDLAKFSLAGAVTTTGHSLPFMAN